MDKLGVCPQEKYLIYYAQFSYKSDCILCNYANIQISQIYPIKCLHILFVNSPISLDPYFWSLNILWSLWGLRSQQRFYKGLYSYLEYNIICLSIKDISVKILYSISINWLRYVYILIDILFYLEIKISFNSLITSKLQLI